MWPQRDRRRLTPDHYFKSAAEMRALFADLPEAVDNTLVIAQRCAFMVESASRSCRPSRQLRGARRGRGAARRNGRRPGSNGGWRTQVFRRWTRRARWKAAGPTASGSTTSST